MASGLLALGPRVTPPLAENTPVEPNRNDSLPDIDTDILVLEAQYIPLLGVVLLAMIGAAAVPNPVRI
jgi:hypothetical protein